LAGVRRRLRRQSRRSSAREVSLIFRTLLVDHAADGHVVTVTLNRPELMNAMNTAMGEDLLACFSARCSQDRDCGW
jgi:1,4-dihydroxy-2-naphthoyl-CoA synthase